jgi:hypothetical protein
MSLKAIAAWLHGLTGAMSPNGPWVTASIHTLVPSLSAALAVVGCSIDRYDEANSEELDP